MKNKLIFSFLFLCLFLAASYFRPIEDIEKLEIPQITSRDVVLEHTGFVLSYNKAGRIPRWVAYELKREHLDGEVSRKNMRFVPDPSYLGWQANTKDYTNSGWSRGHMAPAADMKWDENAMTESFYLTNVCPQDGTLNNRYWKKLEDRIRKWADKYGSVYVVTGPIVDLKTCSRIGENKVAVPSAFFKAVLVKSILGYKSIAFVMKNISSPQEMRYSAMSVNELEELTGIDFFPLLDDDKEEVIESQCNVKEWGL